MSSFTMSSSNLEVDSPLSLSLRSTYLAIGSRAVDLLIDRSRARRSVNNSVCTGMVSSFILFLTTNGFFLTYGCALNTGSCARLDKVEKASIDECKSLGLDAEGYVE